MLACISKSKIGGDAHIWGGWGTYSWVYGSCFSRQKCTGNDNILNPEAGILSDVYWRRTLHVKNISWYWSQSSFLPVLFTFIGCCYWVGQTQKRAIGAFYALKYIPTEIFM